MDRACAASGCAAPVYWRADLDIGPSTDRVYVCEEHADEYEDQGYHLTPPVNKDTPCS